jgi:hypothetical protein
LRHVIFAVAEPPGIFRQTATKLNLAFQYGLELERALDADVHRGTFNGLCIQHLLNQGKAISWLPKPG